MINTTPTCLITGANGYLGSELRNHLTNSGWRVVAAARQPRAPGDVAFSLGQELPPETFRGVRALVHCAYDFGPTSWKEIHRLNVLGTQHLIAQARQAGVEMIVTISSISAYRECRSLYGRAKLLMEESTLAAGGVALRPGLIHGGGNGGMFGRLAAQVARGRPIPLLVGSPCTQYLTPVEDLALLVEAVLAGRIPPPTESWIVAHPRAWPLRSLLQAMAGGRRLKFIPVPWPFVWLGLRAAEMAGLRLAFKSDSVRGLVYQNPRPDLAPFLASGLPIHDFQEPA